MKFSRLVLLIAGMLPSALGAWEDVSPETKSAMVEKTNDALDRVGVMFAKRGYPFERPSMEDARAQRNNRSIDKREELNLDKRSTLDVRFLSSDLEITHFFYEVQENKIAKEGSQLRIFPERQQPKISKDEAVEIAKEFAAAVLGGLPSNVGKPVVRWIVLGGMADVQGKGSVVGYQHGKWEIYWPRVTEEGYPFYGTEHIWVTLYENVGPVFLGVNPTFADFVFLGVGFRDGGSQNAKSRPHIFGFYYPAGIVSATFFLAARASVREE